MGLQIQSQSPYDKQLNNLQRSVFSVKSQTSTLLNLASLRFDFHAKTSLPVIIVTLVVRLRNRPPQRKINIPFCFCFFSSNKAACQAGEFSPTGLANCEACPVNSYQSLLRQTSCIQCPGSSVTLGEGTKSISGCGSKLLFYEVIEKKTKQPNSNKAERKVRTGWIVLNSSFPEMQNTLD